MKLTDALHDPDAQYHVNRVIMFVDMAGFTDLKEEEDEVTWLNTLAWFYDEITEQVQKFRGHIVKYTGDGAMAVFDDSQSQEAINCGIAIQEAVADVSARRRVTCACYIGIAAGEVVKFQTPSDEDDRPGQDDYVGTTVDRAARLCQEAAPKAVFVDRATIGFGGNRNIASNAGRILRRSGDEYLGELFTVRLKGFKAALEYYSIFWDHSPYGRKNTPAEIQPPSGTIVKRPVTGPLPGTSPLRPVLGVPVVFKREDVLCGTVTAWDTRHQRGNIEVKLNGDGGNTESFYFDGTYCVEPIDVAVGRRVWFGPLNARVPGERRLATCVLVEHQKIRAEIASIPPGKSYGFVRVGDRRSPQHCVDLLMPIGDNPERLERGSTVEFIVTENRDRPGAIAANARKVVRNGDSTGYA